MYINTLLLYDGGRCVLDHYNLRSHTKQKQKTRYGSIVVYYSHSKEKYYLKKYGNTGNIPNDTTLDAIDLVKWIEGEDKLYSTLSEIYQGIDFSEVKPVKHIPVAFTPAYVSDGKAQELLSNQTSSFHRYCKDVLGISEEHLKRHGVGTTELGETAFCYSDGKRWYNVKRGWYKRDGKRYRGGNLKGYYEGFRSEISRNRQQYGFVPFGSHLLSPDKKAVCIVESEKTVVIASWFFPDYLFITHHNLKHLKNRIKIPVLYLCDADDAGRNHAFIEETLKLFPEAKILDLFPGRTDKYDLADYVVAGGDQNTLDLLDVQYDVSIRHQRTFRQALSKVHHIHEINKHYTYASDLYPEIERDYISKYPVTLIEMATGAGKTAGLLDKVYGLVRDKKYVFVVPTQSLCEQLGEKYQIAVFYGGEKNKEVEDIINGSSVVTTYDSFSKVAGVFNDWDYIVVDEYHNLANQLNFRSEAILSTIKEIKKWAKKDKTKIIGLSATMPKGIEYLTSSELGLIRVVPQGEARPVEINLIQGGTDKACLIQKVKEFVQSYTGKEKLIIRYQHKRMIDLTRLEIQRELEVLKDLQKELNSAVSQMEVANLYRRSGLEKDEQYISIVKENNTPANTAIILTTSLINDGVSLNLNGYDVEICTIGRTNPFESAQFVSRVRTAKSVKRSIYIKEPTATGAYFDFGVWYKSQYQDALRLADELNKRRYVKEEIEYDLKNPYSQFNDILLIDNEYVVNEYTLLAKLNKSHYDCLDLDGFVQEMKGFHFAPVVKDYVVDVKPNLEALKIENKQAITTIESIGKSDLAGLIRCKIATSGGTYKALKTSLGLKGVSTLTAEEISLQSEHEKLLETQPFRKLVSWAERLHTYTGNLDKSIGLLVQENRLLSNKEFGSLVTFLNYQNLLKADKLKSNQDKATKKELEKILQVIEVGGRYTAKQLHKLVNKQRAKKQALTQNKVISYLGSLFELKRIGENKDYLIVDLLSDKVVKTKTAESGSTQLQSDGLSTELYASAKDKETIETKASNTENTESIDAVLQGLNHKYIYYDLSEDDKKPPKDNQKPMEPF